MELNLAPETEQKLKDIAARSGRSVSELADDAIAIYAGDLAHIRDTLDSRYDDIKSGKVKMIPGDEAFARLHERIEARRRNGPA